MMELTYYIYLAEYIQGVPKKRVILGKMPITGLGRGLKIKIGGVLKNSGKF